MEQSEDRRFSVLSLRKEVFVCFVFRPLDGSSVFYILVTARSDLQEELECWAAPGSSILLSPTRAALV